MVIVGSSLGTSGTVTVGGVPCDNPVWLVAHGQISCTIRPGQGDNKLVVVTAGGQARYALKQSYISRCYHLTDLVLNVSLCSTAQVRVSYGPPILVAPVPTGGDAGGGQTVTLQGTNFGNQSNIEVSIGGANCAIVPGTQIHTSVRIDGVARC